LLLDSPLVQTVWDLLLQALYQGLQVPELLCAVLLPTASLLPLL